MYGDDNGVNGEAEGRAVPYLWEKYRDDQPSSRLASATVNVAGRKLDTVTDLDLTEDEITSLYQLKGGELVKLMYYGEGKGNRGHVTFTAPPPRGLVTTPDPSPVHPELRAMVDSLMDVAKLALAQNLELTREVVKGAKDSRAEGARHNEQTSKIMGEHHVQIAQSHSALVGSLRDSILNQQTRDLEHQTEMERIRSTVNAAAAPSSMVSKFIDGAIEGMMERLMSEGPSAIPAMITDIKEMVPGLAQLAEGAGFGQVGKLVERAVGEGSPGGRLLDAFADKIYDGIVGAAEDEGEEAAAAAIVGEVVTGA